MLRALAFAALLVFSACTPQPDVQASAAACSIYRAVYDAMEEKEAVWFSPSSTRNVVDFAYRGEPSPTPPFYFERETGAFEATELGLDGEPWMRPVTERFGHDTAEIHHAVATGEAQSITHCFQDQADAPGFFSGGFSPLHARETLLGRDNGGFVSLVTVSPVGISANGETALVFVQIQCGGLCGVGMYQLFEASDETGWEELGYAWRWIS